MSLLVKRVHSLTASINTIVARHERAEIKATELLMIPKRFTSSRETNKQLSASITADVAEYKVGWGSEVNAHARL